jgi:acid phosphatase (class A)
MKPYSKALLSVFFALAFSLGGAAQKPEAYLKTEEIPDAVRFLPGPPAPGTIEFQRDSALHFQAKALREGERGERAVREATSNVEKMAAMFSGAFGMELSKEKTPRILYLLDRSVQTFRKGVAIPKNTYLRKRPYVYFNEGTLIPWSEMGSRNSGSYPSGHTVRGWGMALVLAQLNPERQDTLLRAGYEWGQSRVIAGYHWQSDIDAARLVASATFARLQACPEYLQDFAAARQEWLAILEEERKSE